jgi:hypothetical protein
VVARRFSDPLFSAAYPSFVKSKMYVMSAEGGPPREVLPGIVAEFVSPLRVAWHPDGQRLSIWGNHRQFGWSFWTVPLANVSPVQSSVDPSVAAEIKEAAISFRDFVWSPSGHSLIFEGESQGVRNLWEIKVDAQTLRWVNGPERLTTSAGIDTDIALSSDGRKLAFTIRSEESRLWSLPFDSVSGRVAGNGEPITIAGMDAQQPGLSQDGRKLIFRKQRANKDELWIKSLDDGSETLLVAADDFRRVNPIWSHGGRPADLSVSGVTVSGWQRRAGTNISSARSAVAYRLDTGWKMDSGELRLANTGASSPLPIPC